MVADALAELLRRQRELLTDRLRILDRLVDGLRFSARRVPSPLGSETMATLTPEQSETIAALLHRFGALQDLLGAAMKVAHGLEGGSDEGFPAVLSSMAKSSVLSDIDEWTAMRLLRNRAAHEYDLDPERQAESVQNVLASIPRLVEIAASLQAHCRLVHRVPQTDPVANRKIP